MKTARHLRISGRVQGVGYRAWTVGQATRRNLSGWVRNRRDGTVEALVVGDEQAIDAFIAACYEGPLAARVDNIEVRESEETPEAQFRSLPTM
jgi:acylphosphatase